MVYRQWQGILMVIFTNIFLHLFIFYSNNSLALTIGFVHSLFLVLNITMATTHLLFPFFGWLGDHYIPRYHILIIGLTCMIIAGFIALALLLLNYFFPKNFQDASYFWPIVVLVIITSIIGLGIIFSNILQFGTDQLLLGVSHNFLRLVVRWYYWALFIGQQLLYYVFVVLYVMRTFKDKVVQGQRFTTTGAYTLFISALLSFIFSILLLIVIMALKRKFIIRIPAKNGISCLKKTFKIVKYALLYKISRKNDVETSSFLEVGAESNGGPFTEEEIKKTGTFINLVCIITTLISFQLCSDTYSLSEQLINFPFQENKEYDCPSLPALMIIGINPNHIPYLVVLILVPFFQFTCRHCKKAWFSLLAKITFGLCCAFASLASQMAISAAGLYLYTKNELHDSHMTHDSWNISQLTQDCFQYRLNLSVNIKSQISNSTSNDLYWLLSVPQVLSGLGYVFVAMVTLEFICTQVASENKGTILGTWYMTYAVKYLVGVVDAYIINGKVWYIVKSMQLFLMIVLMIVFLCSNRHYQYNYNNELIESTSYRQHPQAVTNNTIPNVCHVTRRHHKRNRRYGAITNN